MKNNSERPVWVDILLAVGFMCLTLITGGMFLLLYLVVCYCINTS